MTAQPARDAEVVEAVIDLAYLTACYCRPDWRRRGIHEEGCNSSYRDALQLVADALAVGLP